MATQFQFDTSGPVRKPDDGQPGYEVWGWPDLSPFVQGYVEAMFKSMWTGQWQGALMGPNGGVRLGLGFSDLAPETLARIMEDCERELELPQANFGVSAEHGRHFWISRHAGHERRARFPPLTPYLGNGGKVYLRDH